LRFEDDFPGAKVVTLEQNYRSTNLILQASNALIEHNSARYEKKLWSIHGDGEKIGLFIASTERGEAEFVAGRIVKHAADYSLDEIAIFYRTNAQSRAFEDALLKLGIRYKIIGGLSFYARREIKDVLAFLRLVVSGSDLISFLRTINLPKRGFGAASLEKLMAAAEEAKVPILPFCQDVLANATPLKLSAKQQTGLASYLKLIHTLRDKLSFLKIHELLTEVISESGYLNFLREDPETFEDRKENLDELIGKAAEWEEEHEKPSLQQFLEELSLRSSADETSHLPTVKLMTLHNSKGLEFPVVFLVGLEENLCPHINSKDQPESLEEERRLCYVGMTRAKKILCLTASSYRFFWGTPQPMRPSRFLKEIPAEYLRNLSPSSFQSTESDNAEAFSPGEKVHHQQFGVGVVERCFETSFGLTYEIHFLEADITRSIVARFAKLQPYHENS
jgi:DNA helicase-2/ATP-dependent DNA helicase PcrA